MATSYSNAGGTGDRTASITVTTTATIGGGTLNNWVDGGINGNASDAWWWDNGQSGREVKFDFGVGVSKIIDEVKLYQDVTSSHGSWKWQGSNNDSSYADIGSSFTLGGVQTQTNTSMSGNTTGYRYYKLLQVSGTTVSTPWLMEIEFKIDAAVITLAVVAAQTIPAFTQALTGLRDGAHSAAASQTLNPFTIATTYPNFVHGARIPKTPFGQMRAGARSRKAT